MGDQANEIRLTIPAAPEFLRLARLAAADVASRAGFSYEDIEDLRIAVDELCHVLMAAGTDGEHLELRFRLLPGGIAVDGEGPPGASPHPATQSDLSRTIVAAVVDEYDVELRGDTLRFRLVKHTPAR